MSPLSYSFLLQSIPLSKLGGLAELDQATLKAQLALLRQSTQVGRGRGAGGLGAGATRVWGSAAASAVALG